MRVREMALVLSWLLLVFHAVNMPIQYDEAVTVLNLVNSSWISVFTTYTDGTNNHLLLSFILWPLVKLGGVHVLLVRLPSLIAAYAFLRAANRLTHGLAPLLRVLFPLALVSTPLFWDYLVMARGYSLGLALLTWGWIMQNQMKGILYGLSILCVPTFAIPVGILWLMKRDWSLLPAVLIPLVGYFVVLPDVLKASFSAAGDGPSVGAFINALHGVSGWLLYVPALLSIAVLKDRKLMMLTLFSLPFLFIGYPRTHLFTALLLLMCLVRMIPVRYSWTLGVLSLASLVMLPFDRIGTEPQTWPVTGYSRARELSSCVSFQKKGIFTVPALYYEDEIRPDCPHFLLESDPTLPFPSELKLFPEVLDQYGVGLYRREDLERVVEAARHSAPRSPPAPR